MRPLDAPFALWGLGFISSRRCSWWRGRELWASLGGPLGGDALQDPEVSEGNEQGVHGLI